MLDTKCIIELFVLDLAPSSLCWIYVGYLHVIVEILLMLLDVEDI